MPWYKRQEEPLEPGHIFYTELQIQAAITDLRNFEEQFGHAPTARKLLERLSVKDKEVEKIFGKSESITKAAEKELIEKLGEKGVRTDD